MAKLFDDLVSIYKQSKALKAPGSTITDDFKDKAIALVDKALDQANDPLFTGSIYNICLNTLVNLNLNWHDLSQELQEKLGLVLRKKARFFTDEQFIANLDTLVKLNANLDQVAHLKTTILRIAKRAIPGLFNKNLNLMLTAFLKLGVTADELDAAGLKTDWLNYINANAYAMNEQHFARTIYLLGEFGFLSLDIINAICKKIPNFASGRFLKPESLQIYTAFTRICLNDPTKWAALEAVLAKYNVSVKHFAEPALQSLTEDAAGSALQSYVYKIVKSIVPMATEEQVLNCMIVDIYIPGTKTVIEVNGPIHYTHDGQLNTQSRKKIAFLEQLGYQVKIVNYVDWDRCATHANKRSYIHALLQQTVTAPVDKVPVAAIAGVATATTVGAVATAAPFVPAFTTAASAALTTVAAATATAVTAPAAALVATAAVAVMAIKHANAPEESTPAGSSAPKSNLLADAKPFTPSFAHSLDKRIAAISDQATTQPVGTVFVPSS